MAEESGKSHEDLGELYWVIDPLDGTANYNRAIPICCVSIGLIHKMKPIAGVIYDFNNDSLLHGSVNTKAVCNEQVIEVSNISDPAEGILITGLPNDTDYSDTAMRNMINNFQSWRKVRMIGSAAMASAYISSGKADAYSETKTYLWDVAAGALLLAEDEAPGADLAALLGAPPSATAFLSAGVCPENFLVGENSPSLCPTISSEIVIGINDLPL